MSRVILIGTTAATVMLTIAAVYFCGGGEIGAIDKKAMKHVALVEYVQARVAWEAGLRKFPDSPKLTYGMGTLLAVRGDLKQAQTYLERAVALSPETPEYHKELGICYLRAGRPADAEQELREVLRLNDAWPEAHFYLGMVYESQGWAELAMKEYVKEVNVNSCCTFAWAKIFDADKRDAARE